MAVAVMKSQVRHVKCTSSAKCANGTVRPQLSWRSSGRVGRSADTRAKTARRMYSKRMSKRDTLPSRSNQSKRRPLRAGGRTLAGAQSEKRVRRSLMNGQDPIEKPATAISGYASASHSMSTISGSSICMTCTRGSSCPASERPTLDVAKAPGEAYTVSMPITHTHTAVISSACQIGRAAASDASTPEAGTPCLRSKCHPTTPPATSTTEP
mmetsp:Transcript_37340/g.114612  ORF Transcript_37340/g.114612 Transcript_37340/m.114612 type:complete len:211 (-) Transcript_37340:53-685(-)